MGVLSGIRGGARWAGDRVGQVDDSVQRGFRYLLGERGGKFPADSHPAKVAYADIMHPIRSELDAGLRGAAWEKPVMVVGTRAFQAGAITAAGCGLYNLTNSFGSPADEQSPQELQV